MEGNREAGWMDETEHRSPGYSLRHRRGKSGSPDAVRKYTVICEMHFPKKKKKEIGLCWE